ncbi:MAG: M1 family aminopeptidase [Bryobacterales bacterium]|nr:M1 family aminopeptidase [Bryobacteraceae bacterium]MDW8130036.1 M1 family aminopeptidase [Bryobacterales bacterium]
MGALRIAALGLVSGASLLAAVETARQALSAGLDPAECYRVRELHFAREDLRFYFTDGYLILGKPVRGRRVSAVFSAETEGGDGEVVLFPPTIAERRSLAFFAGAPNLTERFRSAVLIFTDDTATVLARQMRARGEPVRVEEMGLLMSQQWDPVVRNFLESFQIRLVADLLAGRSEADGFFYAALAGRTLGNFDCYYDPRAREQIAVGQVVFRENRTFFDYWTSFTARSFRRRPPEERAPEFTISSYRIHATIEPDLRVRVVTRARLTPQAAAPVLLFQISPQMVVRQVRIQNEPAEVLQPDSLRVNLLRGDGNASFLVVPAQPLEARREYEIEFHHDGAVISEAGQRVYYVGARGSWYPNAGLHFARYHLLFRYPKELNLVATGELVEELEDGPWRVTERRVDAPVRLAAFNLGEYLRERVSRGGFTVEVYANRRLERALEPPQRVLIVPPPQPPWSRTARQPPNAVAVAIEPPRPDPTARLQPVASEIAAALEFMSRHFGPPPLRTLTVSPIPGAFGQGFPGLIYLSTLAYLDPAQRPAAARDEYQQLFFSEILHAHETAHQWWGNTVTTAHYQDEWLMEALANYSALLWLEQRKGPRALESVLAEYRRRLLAKTGEGLEIESIGPLVWGRRLRVSQAPGAWQTIIYDKGSWVMHMLRRRLGDERFLAMLGQLRRRYQHRPVTTEQFRRLAAEFLPAGWHDPQLENFFEQWVYSTGVASLKLEHSVQGRPPAVTVRGKVIQSGVSDDFSTEVPIEIHFAKGRPIRRWVRTGAEPETFVLKLRERPTRVVLDPDQAVLKR